MLLYFLKIMQKYVNTHAFLCEGYSHTTLRLKSQHVFPSLRTLFMNSRKLTCFAWFTHILRLRRVVRCTFSLYGFLLFECFMHVSSHIYADWCSSLPFCLVWMLYKIFNTSPYQDLLIWIHLNITKVLSQVLIGDKLKLY